MATYRNSRTIPIILTVIVIIIAIVGLVSLARFIFFPGTSTTDTAVVDTSREDLLSSSDERSVEMVVRGPIVADENFRSYKITISPSSRTIRTYTGYLGTILEERTLPNNVAAYEQFVHALDKANMVLGTPFTGDKNDVRGICATGHIYEFALAKNGEQIEKLWTSTCSGSKGSLKASTTQLTQLFLAQVPEGRALIKAASL